MLPESLARRGLWLPGQGALDWEAIRASVGKTSRVLVAYEDCLSWGFGAEIAARIGEELFDDLAFEFGTE